MARLSRSIAVGVVLCVFGTLLLAAPASTTVENRVVRGDSDGRGEEQQFIDDINALRASKGLARLSVDPELTAQARVWSKTMQQAGKIFHSADLSTGVTSNWQKLGENVGVGGTVDALFDAFVASPKHYENLVDPSYRYIGVGVVWDGDRMFTAHRFMAVFPTPATTTPRPKPKPKSPAPRRVTTTVPRPAPTTTAVVATNPPPSTVPQSLAAVDSAAVPTDQNDAPVPATRPRSVETGRLEVEMAALVEYLR